MTAPSGGWKEVYESLDCPVSQHGVATGEEKARVELCETQELGGGNGVAERDSRERDHGRKWKRRESGSVRRTRKLPRPTPATRQRDGGGRT